MPKPLATGQAISFENSTVTGSLTVTNFYLTYSDGELTATGTVEASLDVDDVLNADASLDVGNGLLIYTINGVPGTYDLF